MVADAVVVAVVVSVACCDGDSEVSGGLVGETGAGCCGVEVILEDEDDAVIVPVDGGGCAGCP